MWLQGGPNRPATLGAYLDVGSLLAVEEVGLGGRLVENPHRWTRNANLLFLDSPGSGFSWAEWEAELPASQKEVAAELAVAVTQVLCTRRGTGVTN